MGKAYASGTYIWGRWCTQCSTYRRRYETAMCNCTSFIWIQGNYSKSWADYYWCWNWIFIWAYRPASWTWPCLRTRKSKFQKNRKYIPLIRCQGQRTWYGWWRCNTWQHWTCEFPDNTDISVTPFSYWYSYIYKQKIWSVTMG